MVQIAVFLTAFLDRAGPECAFIGIGGGHRADHRQGQFAFAEIVANVLAGGLGAAVIQEVIDDLERYTQGIAVIEQRLFGGGILSCNLSTHFHRGGKQGGGLAAHDLDVDVFGSGKISGGGQLQHLAFGDGGRGIGEDVEHPQ